jgi:hypothetical protein
MTDVTDIPQTQTDQIPTDLQVFLNKNSRRVGQRKRRSIKLFRRASSLQFDDHILDFADTS